MAQRRVAVTGLGVVSALGFSVQEFWTALTEGRQGFGALTAFDGSSFRTSRVAEVRGDERSAGAYLRRAAEGALEDGSLSLEAARSGRLGIAVGTTFGDMTRLEGLVDRHVRGELAREALTREASTHLPSVLACGLAQELGLPGPALTLTTACAAGNSALIAASDQIRAGRCAAMLAGGVDALSRVEYAAFNRLLAIAPERCAPFSAGRQGLIPGEGCALLLLEDEEFARARGARVYAVLAGAGASCDAAHVTMPDLDGVARAIAACLKDGGFSAEEIDYVSAHGTGTPANDKTETTALKRVLGARAPQVPVSSIKSMLGHAMGAASALEAAASCLTLSTGVLPPTVNFTPGDPDCDLDYVPNAARRSEPRVVLSNAFAFGGSNAVIALAKQGRAGRPERAVPEAAITAAVSLTENAPVVAAERLLPDCDLRAVDPTIALTLCAVKAALDQAGLDVPSNDVGIILDGGEELESLIAFWRQMTEDGPMGIDPRGVPSLLANAPASRAAIVFGLRLLNETLAAGFSSGEAALARACDWLGRAPGALLAGFAAAPAASLLVVEPLERARARGARVLARVGEIRQWTQARARLEPRSDDCACLVKAVRAVAERGKPLDVAGRGAGGGRISLRLEP